MSNGKTHASEPGGGQQWDGLAGLYQDLGRYLRWRAQTLLNDSEEAREVLQETFLAFMRAQPSLRGEASHSTVIQGIFIRQIVNRLRLRSRGAFRTEPLDWEDEKGASSQWEAATEHDGGNGGVEALRELAVLTRGETPQALQVAYLYLLEGHTFGEIGKKLGLRRKVVSQMLQQLIGRAQRRRARFASRADASG